jgi:glycosyltransferase involved in cell wall biosynthesis
VHIALVTRRYPPLIGGAEKVLSYLADAFAAEGAEVTVLTSRIDLATPPIERPRPGLTVVRLATSKLRFVGTWRYMHNLRRWFAANRVDLAYVSMLKHDAFAVVDEGRKRGFPVVLRPEGAGATGDIAWQKWGRFGGEIAERCKKADAVVAISAAVRGELIAEGYDPAKVIDLPNGVPVPSEPWQPHERSVAVFVGRLAKEKGLDAFVDAWPIVRRDRPEARLVLVGDGPERAGLAAQVESLGLQGHVTFAGTSTDPSSYLRAADLFVLPSREEGMSIALLEAMALGVPLVASAIPGNQYLVQDRVLGRLAPPDQPEALGRLILEQWADLDRAALMGQAARRRVAEEFSIAAVARKHLDLFQRLIDARGSRA